LPLVRAAGLLKGMDLLVTPQWVAERLRSLVLVDSTLPPVGVTPAPDMHAAYLAEHLPGAVFFDIDRLSDHSSGLPHTLPTAESFGAAMEELGIAKDATIVVYEQGSVFSAPRGLWMLRVFGAADVHLLNGGLRAWKAAGLPTESGEVKRAGAKFAAELTAGAVTDFDQLQRKIAAGQQILDARSAGRFSGAAAEPRAGISSGHMPGATSMPFTELASGDALKSPEELRAMFAAKGVKLDEPVTTTCGSGVTAAVVSLALELAGAEKLSLYDGSWAEYAQRPEAEIVKDASIAG
jgi:thiosulfate/3-mercaptopyruvate sulfurtransferase